MNTQDGGGGVLADLLAVLARVREPLTVNIRNGGLLITVLAQTTGGGGDAGDDFNRMEEAILQVVGTEPVSSRAIARLTGYSYSSNLRGTLARLRARGALVNTHEGWARPAPSARSPEAEAPADAAGPAAGPEETPFQRLSRQRLAHASGV